MIRKFAVLAAAVAALALAAAPAEAGQHKTKKKVDPRIDAVSTGVGIASTAGYFALDDWSLKWRDVHGVTSLGAMALTTVGCMAASPIVATVVMKRALTYREAHILMGSCLIPIVGGWLVNEAYNEGILTAPDEKPVKVAHHRHKKKLATLSSAER